MTSHNKKAFTLIELLVVVAIIGILAAVGVVAYNGYTSSAKKNATKNQHKTIVKFMQSEIMKCSIGEQVILKQKSGSNVINQSDLCPTINNITSGNNSYNVLSAFDYHFKAIEYKNIYQTQYNATSVCSVKGTTVYHNNGQGGGTCLHRDTNDEIIVGTNIAPNDTVITKFKVQWNKKASP